MESDIVACDSSIEKEVTIQGAGRCDLLKRSRKGIGLIRGLQETLFMIIGLIGSQGAVTPLTVILSLFFGYIIQFEYKLLKYDPTKIKHKFLIKGKEVALKN